MANSPTATDHEQAEITAQNIVSAGYFDAPVTQLAEAYLALSAGGPRAVAATDQRSLIERLEFIANDTHKVRPEEIEEVCDLAAKALRSDSEAHTELLQIHEAIMDPMRVQPAKGDYYTLKRVKEFIQRAVGTGPYPAVLS